MNTHLLILILSVVVASFSQILLKKSAQKTYRSIIYEYLNPYVICGYGMMFLSMFLTIIAYSGMDFTNVQIVEATGYIMVLILSYFFFHETGFCAPVPSPLLLDFRAFSPLSRSS